MSKGQYVPPSRRLFNSRHRVSRQELRGLSDVRIDWSMTLDESIEEDSLISYAVPVVGFDPRLSILSSESGDSLFEPDLSTQMQSNMSLESLIQENKKRISASQEELELFKVAGDQTLKNSAKEEVSKLQGENAQLFQRSKVLQERWAQVRRSHDRTVLLIEIGKNGLQWFGIPADLRFRVYQCCLYLLPESHEPRDSLYSAILQCCADESLSAQIHGNIKRSVPFLMDGEIPLEQSKLIESRISSSYPGLYYHLTVILKWDLMKDFVQPLLLNSLCNCLKSHTIAWELIDILVFSAYYRELQRIIADEFLMGVLEQTHFKFFSDKPANVQHQLQHFRIDLVELLEHLRRSHGQALVDAT